MPDNVWPDDVREFRENLTWLYAALDGLGVEVLRAIAHFLKLERHAFDEAVKDGNSVLRLLHYPPVPFDGPHVRAAAHEDINFITLLVAAKGAGLQLLDRDGTWLPVETAPKNLIVDSGDMLARATNDVLPSTTHRVVNPAPERRGVARYSTPFFLHFAPDHLIQTLPGCAGDGNLDR